MTCLVLLLAACGSESAPAGEVQQSDASPAAPRPGILQCMPATLVSMQLPLEAGLAQSHDAAPTMPHVIDCVLELFGTGAIKSPAAFDRGYGQVFAHHEEDGTLALASLPREDMQLFRLGATADANVWLLRADTGGMLGPSYYDIVFTTGKASGTLVDHLLVGTLGMSYRRDYDIDAVDAFAIHEETGTQVDPGPGYRARYRIGDDGRFVLVSGEVLPP